MKDLWGRFTVLICSGGLIVLATVAACVGGGAPVPQRIEVTAAAIIVELYAAVGASYDRAWAIALCVIDLVALAVAFRIHHTTDKLLLGVPAIAALALAIIHTIVMESGAAHLGAPDEAM